MDECSEDGEVKEVEIEKGGRGVLPVLRPCCLFLPCARAILNQQQLFSLLPSHLSATFAYPQFLGIAELSRF